MPIQHCMSDYDWPSLHSVSLLCYPCLLAIKTAVQYSLFCKCHVYKLIISAAVGHIPLRPLFMTGVGNSETCWVTTAEPLLNQGTTMSKVGDPRNDAPVRISRGISGSYSDSKDAPEEDLRQILDEYVDHSSMHGVWRAAKSTYTRRYDIHAISICWFYSSATQS